MFSEFLNDLPGCYSISGHYDGHIWDSPHYPHILRPLVRNPIRRPGKTSVACGDLNVRASMGDKSPHLLTCPHGSKDRVSAGKDNLSRSSHPSGDPHLILFRNPHVEEPFRKLPGEQVCPSDLGDISIYDNDSIIFLTELGKGLTIRYPRWDLLHLLTPLYVVKRNFQE